GLSKKFYILNLSPLIQHKPSVKKDLVISMLLWDSITVIIGKCLHMLRHLNLGLLIVWNLL
ncbi:hypothetical protein ACJX0J_015631, partial [Zea mays]